MEFKRNNKKKTLFEAIADHLFADYLFRREMVNRKHCYQLMQREQLSACRLLAIGAIILELVYFIRDLFPRTNQYVLYRSGEIFLIVMSIIMLLVCHFLAKTHKYMLMRIACSSFLLMCIVTITIFMCADLLDNPESLSFSFFYVMILAFVPSTYFIDNFILFGFSAGGVAIANFVVTESSNQWFKYYALLTVLLFIALAFRSNQIRSTIYMVKEGEMHEVVKLQTYTDILTCALNRRALEELLFDNFDGWKSSNADVALIMFDVDNFKEYNDNFSHLTGDEVLKLVASTASQLCNKNMPNIFRYGGDEFFMVIVGSDRLDVLTKSLDLLRSVSKLKIRLNKNEEVYLTISVGVTMLNNKIDTPAEFISAVDENLYYAKNNGKACVAFDKKIYR